MQGHLKWLASVACWLPGFTEARGGTHGLHPALTGTRQKGKRWLSQVDGQAAFLQHQNPNLACEIAMK